MTEKRVRPDFQGFSGSFSKLKASQVMKTKRRSLFATFAAAAVLAVSAFLAAVPARAGDVYRVTGIPVDASAENATAARAKAVAEGQARAFEEVLRKVTRREDWQRLPPADEATAQSLVRSFQVAGEKTSTTRYLAELTVTFNPQGVRRLLRQYDIPYADAQAKPALLLPLWRDIGGTRQLWDDNPWRAAWSGMDLANRLTPLTLPLGDLEDLTTLSAEAAAAGDDAALQAFAERYGTNRVIVAEASPAGESGLQADMVLYEAGSVMPARRWSRRVSGEESLEALGRQAAELYLDHLAEEWKAQSTVGKGEAAALSASVRFNSMGEWVSIKRKLEQSPNINRVTLVGLSTEGALVEIDYQGSADGLGLTLAQQNLSLMEMEGYWVLAARQ